MITFSSLRSFTAPGGGGEYEWRRPGRETRNRKILAGLVPLWEHLPPVWELRIGEYRVFYDVDEKTRRVMVRAVRHKPPHKTTEEII